MLKIGGKKFSNHMIMGSASYPSLEVLIESIKKAKSEIVTVSLRRQVGEGGNNQKFYDQLKALNLTLLPNTAGCRSVKEAVTTAYMARELFNTNWIKLEIIGDEYTLQPDPILLVEAAKILSEDDFLVFPYMTEDLVIAERLVSVGCEILMPWAAPIGSGKGLLNKYALNILVERFKEFTLIIDAGIRSPSQAAEAMELGFDAVLLNTAIAEANDPALMAEAFSMAISAGKKAYDAGLMQERDFASPSTPVIGTPFFGV